MIQTTYEVLIHLENRRVKNSIINKRQRTTELNTKFIVETLNLFEKKNFEEQHKLISLIEGYKTLMILIERGKRVYIKISSNISIYNKLNVIPSTTLKPKNKNTKQKTPP